MDNTLGRFDDLSDLDFEELVADLLRADTGLPFRAGVRGPDGGIDVRAIAEGDVHHVVQVKHYRVPAFSKLLDAATEQAARFDGIAPSLGSYRFITSMSLSHLKQLELMEALGGLAPTTDSVLGESDVRSLLRRHPEVQARHVKLWLPETGVLQRLLNAAAYERSESWVADTRDALPRYVQTDSFFSAREMLQREHVCVIAGPPGVGKTTLARLLAMDGLRSGFQPYVVAPDHLEEAWALLSYDENQLFLFDDFLGETALFESREDDGEIVRFMKRISKDPRRRFVLTTREYILQQAQQLSEVLERETGEHHKFVFSVDDYSRLEKARIFYNHVYFSDEVDTTAKASLLDGSKYFDVVDHPGFSPRLIEGMTGLSGYRLSDDDRENFADFCVRTLEHPAQLWLHAFENGLGAPERTLLFAMLGMGGATPVYDTEEAFEAACGVRQISTTERQFHRSLAVLNDSFLTASHVDSEIRLSFLNPSVIDFLKDYLRESPADITATIRSATFFGQVMWLWGFVNDGSRSPSDIEVASVGEAIARTITRDQSDRRRFFIADLAAGRRRFDTLLGRVEAAVDACSANHLLLGECGPTLNDQANLLVARMLSDNSVEGAEIRLLKRMEQVCGFDLDPHFERIKQLIRAMPESIGRWDRLDDLRRARPDGFSASELTEEHDALEAFASYALDEGLDFFDDVDDLRELENIADYFNVELDDEKVSEVEQDIEAVEAQRTEQMMDLASDIEREDFESARGGSDSDDDISLMFSRI